MFLTIWNDFLYQPLFNVLIWIYSSIADHNLGWAVVYLTVFLRIVLLPLTIITERNKIKNEQLHEELQRLEKDYKNDPILQKQEARKIVKQRRVKPWAKVFALGVQILVLVLLYQVFLRGITGEKLMKYLYEWVDFPGTINIYFYGFNLGDTHTIIWPAIVAVFLFIEIYIDYHYHKYKLNKTDLFYAILFPLASFYLLWILPMVKSLFILTTLIFSVIVHQFLKLFFQETKPKKA